MNKDEREKVVAVIYLDFLIAAIVVAVILALAGCGPVMGPPGPPNPVRPDLGSS